MLVTEAKLRRFDRLRNDVDLPRQARARAHRRRRGRRNEDVTFVTVDARKLPLQARARFIGCTFDLGLRPDRRAVLRGPGHPGGQPPLHGDSPERQLAVGDVITVAKGRCTDQRRNPSRLTRYTVREHADNSSSRTEFKVAQAAVGTAKHTKQATLLISNHTLPTPPGQVKRLRITAKSTGVAGGASGNGWVVYPYVDPDRSEPASSQIEVGVDTVHRIISYTIVDGKITLANLAAALNRNSTFRSKLLRQSGDFGRCRARYRQRERSFAVGRREQGRSAGAVHRPCWRTRGPAGHNWAAFHGSAASPVSSSTAGRRDRRCQGSLPATWRGGVSRIRRKR